MMSKIEFASAKSHHCHGICSGVLASFVLIAAALPMLGCRICADCEDLAYPAYGGAWERTNREHGRVGSLFDPGGAKASDLVDRDEPSQPDEIIRELQKDKKSQSDPDEVPEDRDGDADSIEPDDDKPKNLRDRKLEDVENLDEEKLREKSLDDIEVRIIPGRKPVMVNSK